MLRPSATIHDGMTQVLEFFALLGGCLLPVAIALAFAWLLGTDTLVSLAEYRITWILLPLGILSLPLLAGVLAFRAMTPLTRRIAARCEECRGRAYRMGSRPATYRCCDCGRYSSSRLSSVPMDPLLDRLRSSADEVVSDRVSSARRRDAQGGTLTMPPPEEQQGSVSLARDAAQVSLPPKK